jgi:hypothetical protein
LRSSSGLLFRTALSAGPSLLGFADCEKLHRLCGASPLRRVAATPRELRSRLAGCFINGLLVAGVVEDSEIPGLVWLSKPFYCGFDTTEQVWWRRALSATHAYRDAPGQLPYPRRHNALDAVYELKRPA